MRVIRPSLLSAASVLAAAALVLTGCGGSGSSSPGAQSGPTSGGASGGATSGASQAVVQGVKLTPDGSSLKVGDTAHVSWQPDQKKTGVIAVRVTRLQKVPLSAFKDWRLTGSVLKSTPYYVHATVKNLGTSNLSGMPVPLYVLDGGNTLLESSTFRARYAAVPEPALPLEVHPGPDDLGLPGLLRAGPREARRGQLPPHPGRRRHHLARAGRRREALTVSLALGPLTVPVPVVLAPMAGITNAAYRRLCAEQGAGLYVCEMITSRGLVERDPTTLKMLVFDDLETTRSVQLYGTDPSYVAKATEILCAEYGVHHVDLNFGCPVPKVTRKGGGGALPWKRGLLADILRASVAAAAPYDVPVTMKTRKGLDDDHLTYLDAGRIAEDSGIAAIALHGRTVAQAYSGRADWDAIAGLVERVDIPVLGNGDIWEAGDALRMVEQTGAAGVVVGRGCLGRPWLFRDLAAAFSRRRGAHAAHPRRGAHDDAPPRGAPQRPHGGGAGLQGVPQARLVVPQGLPRRR